jgi:UDP:flavonoid glycosyltransferase YjiC (YdhE family)
MFWFVRWMVSRWTKPYQALRKELGLPDVGNPVFEGQWSPYLNLGLFSKHFAPPQKDWPAKALLTGFCFYDHDEAGSITPELSSFLDTGPPPVVFTLGSSAVRIAGKFFVEALGAIQGLGCRALLLVGQDMGNVLPTDLPPTIHVGGYVPYSELFPHVRAIVHQGGIGTMAQALRASHPMLVVPWAQDQPDNADHARRLGLARVVSAQKFTAVRAFHELFPLLHDPLYATRAAEVGQRIAAEDGAATAAQALEGLLG